MTNPINVVFGASTIACVPIAVQAIGTSAQAQSLADGVFTVAVVALTTDRRQDAIIE